MGAYSSWASLAIVHHFIVQFCAFKVGRIGWYKNYAILGDDIVIGDADVAKKYLEVLSTLGVGVGLHKSLLSPSGTAVEFAKRTFFRGQDVSPFSVKELIASFGSPSAAVELIRKHSLTLAQYVRAAGFGFRVLGSLNRAFSRLNSKIKLIILAIHITKEVSEIGKFFQLGVPHGMPSLFESRHVMEELLVPEVVRLRERLMRLRLKLRIGFRFDDGLPIILDSAIRKLQNSAYVLGPGFVIKTRERMYSVEQLRQLFFRVMILTLDDYRASALHMFDRLIEQLRDLTLLKFRITSGEMFLNYITLVKEIATYNPDTLIYGRSFQDQGVYFTDGFYIKMWKAIAGSMQGHKGLYHAGPGR
jgi:hypothetical protein